MAMQDQSYRTAIARRALSAPMAVLKDMGLLTGRVLDYGCGRGLDKLYLGPDAGGAMDLYDPHYFPDEPTGTYDTITCQYVLNTISEIEAVEVVRNIYELLSPGGKAYITVRRDEKDEYTTSRGTYNRYVVLDLIRVHKNRNFEIYLFPK